MTFKDLKEQIQHLEDMYDDLDNCIVFDSEVKPVVSIFREDIVINDCKIPVITINSR